MTGGAIALKTALLPGSAFKAPKTGRVTAPIFILSPGVIFNCNNTVASTRAPFFTLKTVAASAGVVSILP